MTEPGCIPRDVCLMPVLAPGPVLSPKSGSPGSHGGSEMLFISFPTREDKEQIASRKSPSIRSSMARDRYSPIPDTAEVVQRGTKPMTSHQSSLTSLEESRPSGLLPRKALLRAGGPHTEVSVLVEWSEDPLVSELCSWPLLSLTLFMCPRFLHCFLQP